MLVAYAVVVCAEVSVAVGSERTVDAERLRQGYAAAVAVAVGDGVVVAAAMLFGGVGWVGGCCKVITIT